MDFGERLAASVERALREDILECPDCGAGLVRARSEIACRGCGSVFSARDGILELRPARWRAHPARPATSTDDAGSAVQRFIAHVYARHNKSKSVRHALGEFWQLVDPNGFGVNIGSGSSGEQAGAINLDIAPGPHVNVLGDAHRLPFRSGTLSWIVSQEVFEHLPDPFIAAAEVARVLRPGGTVYLQVPFIIGYHSIPHDYYRFTSRGLRFLVERSGLSVIAEGTAVGPGTSVYRILVELAATLAAVVGGRSSYRLAKASSAVLLAPVRLLDRLPVGDDSLSRIPAGFYIIAEKPRTDTIAATATLAPPQ
jgi:SAM-dependent methyltransferase